MPQSYSSGVLPYTRPGETSAPCLLSCVTFGHACKLMPSSLAQCEVVGVHAAFPTRQASNKGLREEMLASLPTFPVIPCLTCPGSCTRKSGVYLMHLNCLSCPLSDPIRLGYRSIATPIALDRPLSTITTAQVKTARSLDNLNMAHARRRTSSLMSMFRRGRFKDSNA